MSGGHWDYRQYNLEGFLNDVSVDVKERFPKLEVVFSNLSEILGEILHDLDWDYSGDSLIDNDKQFEKEAIEKLINIFKEINRNS